VDNAGTTEAGVGTSGLACIHMGTESTSLGRAKGEGGAAYVMPGGENGK